MREIEPELITIIEGPTPEFEPSPYLWFQSVYEGPEDATVLMCELRSLNGEDIVERCAAAWKDGRPVRLDFPDNLRMRRQKDVVAMQLQHVDEGDILRLWLRQPYSEIEEEFDEGEDDFSV